MVKGNWIHTSALLSAFLSKSRMNLADLTGQRPCPFECLFFAWAVRPTPLQKRVKGMACLWTRTSSKYLLALAKGNFLMAWAVSLVFYWHNIEMRNTMMWVHNKLRFSERRIQKWTTWYPKKEMGGKGDPGWTRSRCTVICNLIPAWT